MIAFVFFDRDQPSILSRTTDAEGIVLSRRGRWRMRDENLFKDIFFAISELCFVG